MEELKQKGMELLMAGLSVILGIKPILITMTFLLVVDMITGIIASSKRGEKITSKKLSNTITKIFLYNVVIISSFLIQSYVITDFHYLVEIVAGILCIIEFYSLVENMSDITGLNIFNVIKNLLKKNSAVVGITEKQIDDVSNILEETNKNIKQKENETV